MLTYISIFALADDEQLDHLAAELQMLEYGSWEYMDARAMDGDRSPHSDQVIALFKLEPAMRDGFEFRQAQAGLPWLNDDEMRFKQHFASNNIDRAMATMAGLIADDIAKAFGYAHGWAAGKEFGTNLRAVQDHYDPIPF